MRTINLYEAKTHLSALVDAALRGEDVTIARRGEALVRLVPLKPRRRSDAYGRDAGLIVIADDFDETPSDFNEYR